MSLGTLQRELLAYLGSLVTEPTVPRLNDRSRLPLDRRMRPTSLEHVIGQAEAVDALARVLARHDKPHLYLFSGPSGVGKTTLARIVAATVGSTRPVELDGGIYSSVEDIREMREYVQYRSLTGGPKVVILDECHLLSAQAWGASLKLTEEPPDHVYFVFCTTVATKLPETILTRATHFVLTRVGAGALLDYAVEVVRREGMAIPDDALPRVVKAAAGSVRRMLNLLARYDGFLEPESIVETIVKSAPTQARLMQIIAEVSQPLPNDDVTLALAMLVKATVGVSSS